MFLGGNAMQIQSKEKVVQTTVTVEYLEITTKDIVQMVNEYLAANGYVSTRMEVSIIGSPHVRFHFDLKRLPEPTDAVTDH
jgi:hypothetical protein